MKSNYTLLSEELKQITHLGNILSLTHWDAATSLPNGAAINRQQEMTTLANLLHSKSTSKSLGNLIKAAKQELSTLDKWQQANVLLAEQQYFAATCIDASLQEEHTIATTECEFKWRSARAQNDYQSLVPYLDRVFKSLRQISKQRASALQCSAMEAMLELYDPGRKISEVNDSFEQLKNQLPPLIAKILDKQKTEKFVPLNAVDIDTQKAVALRLISSMGFDMNCGRLGESTHPFCSGSNDDVRLTTRYDEQNIFSGILGAIHEAGHGLYQQNLPAAYRNQPVGMPKGMAFHESQSLIMEMQAATSKSFAKFMANILVDEFKLAKNIYNDENIYKILTRVQPSLIRVEADEVTYPLHIIIRWEIEQLIIEENLSAKDLPAIWNQKIQEYLGIKVPNDQKGCLQDIHWPSGSCGYFPCYTIGAIIASMLMKQAKSQNDINSELISGNFASLNAHLNQNLRSYGSLHNSQELLRQGTGSAKIDTNIFIDYLTQKYLED